MQDKRHVVLYGAMAVALVVIVALKLSGYPKPLSDTTPTLSVATSTIEFATTTTPTATVATSIPVQTHAPTKTTFRIEIVKDLATQERGLGGRANVPENYGMLFVFPSKQKVGFWMKDMLVPIDIVWLADNGTILAIDDSVSPTAYRSDSDADVFYPPQPVRYVLETRAGEMRRLGWSVGSRLPFTLP